MTTLTASDRCDRCGARAAVVVPMKAADLMFCHHHWVEHRDQLKAACAAATTTPRPT